MRIFGEIFRVAQCRSQEKNSGRICIKKNPASKTHRIFYFLALDDY